MIEKLVTGDMRLRNCIDNIDILTDKINEIIDTLNASKPVWIRMPEKQQCTETDHEHGQWCPSCSYSQAYNQALQDVLSLNKEKVVIPSKEEIFKTIKDNHILTQGHCDTDTFVVVPIKELTDKIHDLLTKKEK